MASTILNDVKLALRKPAAFTALDDEYTANIAEARAEMVRLGIDQDIAEDESNALVVGAIKTYVKMIHADDKDMMDRYEKSWLYQVDCLRKTKDFTEPEPAPNE